MGFTSLVGAAAFLATTMLLSLGFYVHVGGKPQPFFKKGDNLWTQGISEAAMSFIMFWTLFYDIVHIY